MTEKNYCFGYLDKAEGEDAGVYVHYCSAGTSGELFEKLEKLGIDLDYIHEESEEHTMMVLRPEGVIAFIQGIITFDELVRRYVVAWFDYPWSSVIHFNGMDGQPTEEEQDYIASLIKRDVIDE